MNSKINKGYQPNLVESKWYQIWINNDCFTPSSNSNNNYSIVIPPPNVTGILHLGHVLNNTIQDVLARRARMMGKSVLWFPGTDHAGIATQTKVEQKLYKEEKKLRSDIGREEFLKKIWEWKDVHGEIIINQLKRLGCSCDWERVRFTMDDNYSKWVSKAFVDLFNEGMIYRGSKMVNWCPKSLTAISDEEVIMKPQRSKLYYIKYKIDNSKDEDIFLEVATSRPETIMGDTAIAVNPEDERYKDFIGSFAIRPFPKAKIPIIQDSHIDPKFGTGVLKVTPAHDKSDFEIGVRNNLKIINILHPDGKLNELAGEEFANMDRFKAREKVSEKLKDMDLLIKIEDYDNHVGYSERANVPIEPRISKQWFLKYPCVQETINSVSNGEIKFRPKHWEKTFLYWMNNIQDWCISRQLWWGHQIPVWYKKNKLSELKNKNKLDLEEIKDGLYVGINPPDDINNWERDPDVLDTWFSSWLWPFAVMDNNDKFNFKDDIDSFYPTDDLVTGPDIIFFWVSRMIMASHKWQNKIPFKNVFFTSIIRDTKGRKMSKQLGNSPDPIDLIDKHGADALRFGLMRIAPTGSDVKFDEKQIIEGRNFINKLWNASKYRELQGDINIDPNMFNDDLSLNENISIFEIDILAKLQKLESDIQAGYRGYKFNDLANILYDFFWNEYCDWFVEVSKESLKNDSPYEIKKSTLKVMDQVLGRFLIQSHPFMPHVSEEIWNNLSYGKNFGILMLTKIPTNNSLKSLNKKKVKEIQIQVENIYSSISKIRNLKSEYELSTNKNVALIIDSNNDYFLKEINVFKKLSGIKEIEIKNNFIPEKGTPTVLTNIGKVYMPIKGITNIEDQKNKLLKEVEKIELELQKVDSKLSNKQFIENAPNRIVEEMNSRKEKFNIQHEELKKILNSLNS